MNDKTEQPDEMTKDDFNELVAGIAQGIDSLLENYPELAMSYVFCVHHTDLEEMGVATNTALPNAVNLLAALGQRMSNELNKTEHVKESGIILPH